MRIKLTKNELKKQKDSLKQFERYLPTLSMKKQQLQIVIFDAYKEIEEIRKAQKKAKDALSSWVAVYASNRLLKDDESIINLVKIKEIKKTHSNVAGVVVPIFSSLEFESLRYDLDIYPLWVDTALEALKNIAKYTAMVKTLEEEIALLERELRITSQRVNLFEKVKIPEAKENIKKINIYLQDQSTQAVVRGKIAKKKKGEKSYDSEDAQVYDNH